MGEHEPPRRRRRPATTTRPTRRSARSSSPISSARRRPAPTSRSSSRRRARGTRRSTTCSSSARRASARRRWRRSSSRELGVNFRATSGPVIAKAGDLAALLTNLEERDVLFIDEIHRLIAGGRGDPLSGDGGFPARPDHRRGAGGALGQDRPRAVHAGRRHDAARPSHHAAPRPLRHPDPARFLHGRGARDIVRRGARILGVDLTDDGATEIARRSRGTPRIATRLLRRVRDFAAVDGVEADRRARAPTRRCAGSRSTRIGLDPLDRRYLS